MRILFLTTALFLLASFGPQTLWGQMPGQFGGGGPSSGFSQPGSSGSSAGGRTSQGMFGSRNIGSGIGGAARTFGGSGPGAANFDPSGGGAGQLSGNERFMRGNRQPGQFVGSDAGELNNFIGALTGGLAGRSGAGLPQGVRGREGSRRLNNRGDDFGGNSRRRTIPVRVQVAFDHPRPAPSRLSATLAMRLERIAAGSSVQVEIEGRTAVLRGVVATDHDRDLAGQLARLEAGISAVRNELTVAPPEAELPQPAAVRPSRDASG